MSDEATLLPCWFCGGEAYTVNDGFCAWGKRKEAENGIL